MNDLEIQVALLEVVPTAGPLGFHLAKAIEEIQRLRRALRAAEDHIKEIREVVGKEGD
jgi:hypothetical protein